MPITLDGTNGITTPTYGGTDTSEYLVPVTAFKNRIINGAMMIDQRNAGASVTPTNGQYSVDRWQAVLSQASKYSIQQNAGAVTPPVGFTNYLGITSLSAYTVGSSELFNLVHSIEAFNFNDFAWGTASAQSATLSFWVRSSLTGTFGGALNNGSANRFYPFTYTISVANTWEYKTVTIAGDTSGTWAGTNGVGLQIRFGLGVGSTFSGTAGTWGSTAFYSATGATSVVGTNGATFYITGVQLEKGSTATSFDYRPYGTELQLCQRYYWRISSASGTVDLCSAMLASTVSAYGVITYPQVMRTAAAVATNATTTVRVSWTAGTSVTTAFSVDRYAATSSLVRLTTSGLTAGQGAWYIVDSGASNYIEASAEL